MGWLGPCRQVGMPLEYSIMAITSEDNLNSYGGSNVSPLASLDAPPCYPLWTLQKHPPWRLTANFLHSCFGGQFTKRKFLDALVSVYWEWHFLEGKKTSACGGFHDAVTFIQLFFLLTLKLLPKKTSVFRRSFSEIWQCSPWAKRSKTDKSQKLEVFVAKGCLFLHPPKLAKAFWLNHWLRPFQKLYFSVARPNYEYLSISECLPDMSKKTYF